MTPGLPSPDAPSVGEDTDKLLVKIIQHHTDKEEGFAWWDTVVNDLVPRYYPDISHAEDLLEDAMERGIIEEPLLGKIKVL